MSVDHRMKNHDLKARFDALDRIQNALQAARGACGDYTEEFTDEPEGYLLKTLKTVHSVEASLREQLGPKIRRRQDWLDEWTSCDNCYETHHGDSLLIIDDQEHLCVACVEAELLRLRSEADGG